MHFFGIIKIKQPVQSCFTKIYTQHCQPENFFKAQSNGQFIGYFKPQRAQILIDDQGKEVCTYFLCTCYLFLAKSLSNLNLFRAKCIVAYMIQIAEKCCTIIALCAKTTHLLLYLHPSLSNSVLYRIFLVISSLVLYLCSNVFNIFKNQCVSFSS